MNLNKVMIAGNLTRDPDTRRVGESQVCEFGVAVNRRYRDRSGNPKEDVVFVDVSAWGKVGETINKFFRKGQRIFVEGRLRLDQWEDKDGTRRSKLSVTAESFQFVDRKGEDK